MMRDAERSSVLSYDQARSLGETVLRLSTAESTRMILAHTVRTITRIANGQVLYSNDGDRVSLFLKSDSGQRGHVDLRVNQLDLPHVREAVQYLDQILKQQPGSPERIPSVTGALPVIPNDQIWHASTVDAMSTARDTALPQVLDVLDASSLVGAGFLGFMARSHYILDRNGINAYYRETDTQCAVTARSRDGKSSGWAGQSARAWPTLNPVAIAKRAVEVGMQAQNPVGFEPGRRTAILSATAVAQLVRGLEGAFLASDGSNADRFGKQVLDSRLTLRSDPFDPEAGHVPFYASIDTPLQDVVLGLPLAPLTWVEGGVLRNLTFGVQAGALHGIPYNRLPLSVRLEPVPGTTTQSVDEMIEQCELGIYVNRFSSVTSVGHGMMSGVTRDGCFLIKRGKIEKSVKNFRFIDSPLFVFNRVMAIGKPRRADVSDEFSNGPSLPIIAPPMMVRDFNFSAMSEAV